MRPLYLILGIVGLSLADGIHGQRRGRTGRRGGRPAVRRGRQEAAPLGGYGAEAPPLDNYAADSGLDARSAELDALAANIPGVPGEDYPIYSEVPESGFVCDGQVDGGYYADPEAECQVFHICTSDGKGGLGKYSFLCPNGTIFNQNYFICDWWFNFDCEEAADLYSLNDDIAAARDAASGAQDEYGAPPPEYEDVPVYEEADSRDNYAAPAPVAPRDSYAAADSGYEAPADYVDYEEYPVEEVTEAIIEERLPSYEEEQPVYEAQADYNAAAPLPEGGEILEVVRSGRNRQGRRGRNGRRQGRQGRQQGRRQQGRRGGRGNGRNGRRFRG